jgi:hypothetical protein
MPVLENRPFESKAESTLFLIAVAGEHRKARVLWEAWVAGGKFTQYKDRTAIRFYTASVGTIGAKASLGGLPGRVLWALHTCRITGAA